jgi:hypothetical protein
MIISVSILVIGKGAATPVSLVNFSIFVQAHGFLRRFRRIKGGFNKGGSGGQRTALLASP